MLLSYFSLLNHCHTSSERSKPSTTSVRPPPAFLLVLVLRPRPAFVLVVVPRPRRRPSFVLVLVLHSRPPRSRTRTRTRTTTSTSKCKRKPKWLLMADVIPRNSIEFPTAPIGPGSLPIQRTIPLAPDHRPGELPTSHSPNPTHETGPGTRWCRHRIRACGP